MTCGEGVQQRERRCDSPQPLFGGKSCDELELGPSIETKACVLDSCPGEIILLEILSLEVLVVSRSSGDLSKEFFSK